MSPTPAQFRTVWSPPGTPREPHFLGSSRGRSFPDRVPDRAVFPGADGPWDGGALHRPPDPPPSPAPAAPDTTPEPEPEPVMASPPLPPSSPPVPAGPGPEEYAERIAAAVSALRLTAERLAEATRSDTIELALLLARKVVDAELVTSVEPLFSLIRTVLRKAGESQTITVRLSPDDAARVQSADHGKTAMAVTAAQVSVVADPGLQAGDCVVDADFGRVEARLDARFEELRRLLREATASPVGGDEP